MYIKFVIDIKLFITIMLLQEICPMTEMFIIFLIGTQQQFNN